MAIRTRAQRWLSLLIRDEDALDALPSREEQSSGAVLRLLFAVSALLFFRFSVFGRVSMATTKEIDARDKLQALLEASQAALRAQRSEEAIHPLEELTRIQPKNHVYWWQRATVLGQLRRRREEAEVLEQFVKVSPLPGEACPRLGFVYQELGEKDAALDAFKRCAAFSPNDLQDAFYLGQAYERDLQTNLAFEVYTEALKKGVSGDLEAGLGRMLLWKGRPAAAYKAVQPTLVRNPNNSDALLVAGIALSRQARYAQAKELLDRGAGVHDDSDFQFALGIVAEVTGRRSDAVLHYKASIAFDPKNKDAHDRLKLFVPKRKEL